MGLGAASWFLTACAAGSMGSGGAGRNDDGPAVVTVGSTDDSSSATPVAEPTDTASGTNDGLRCTAGKTTCSSLCVDLATDSANCGSCGHSCLGGACGAGRCSPVVALQAETTLDSFDVAFGTVVAATSEATLVLLPGSTAPLEVPLIAKTGFRVVDVGVAFTDEQSNVRIADFSGQAPELLFARPQPPRALGYALGSLHWIEKNTDSTLGDADQLVLGDLYWGDSHVLAAPGEPIALAASAGYYVYYATKSGKLQRTLRDRWADPGSDVVELQDLGAAPTALAATYGLVAWVPAGAARVEGLTTRTRQAFATSPLPSVPSQLVGDDDAVYFVVHPTPATTSVARVAAGAPDPTILWTGEGDVAALRVDDSAVYWSTTAGTVWRVAK